MQNLNEFLNPNLILLPWQWGVLAASIFGGFLIGKGFYLLIKSLLNKKLPVLQLAPNEKLSKAIRPLDKIILLGVVHMGVLAMQLNKTQLAFAERVLIILFSFVMVWLGHRIVDLFTFYFTDRASRTETKFDDILVPLVSKTCYVVVYMLGLVYVLHSFTVNVTALVAGLGIGGLAFAFAAKDTIENLFGSVMLVMDRPFDIGDPVRIDSIEGTVVAVGFRSTRIRSASDSIMTIPNGKIINSNIDNLGKRRYRRHQMVLGLEYGTTPAQVEAFCEGIRQLILAHKWTRKDNFHVYFTNFGQYTLDVTLTVFWVTSDFAREQAEKHRLMVDILRLAQQMQINFAFPTQTVYNFEGRPAQPTPLPEKYLDYAIEQARKLAEAPLSLKNPRSNMDDVNQFGRNDIGL